MEMPDAEEYILRIRKLVGKEYWMVVPDTKEYQQLLNKMKDRYLIIKHSAEWNSVFGG